MSNEGRRPRSYLGHQLCSRYLGTSTSTGYVGREMDCKKKSEMGPFLTHDM